MKIKYPKFQVRVYDVDLFNKVEDTYYANAKLFKSKNNFLLVCIERGIAVVKEELKKVSKDKEEIEKQFSAINSQISEMDFSKSSKVILLMLSNIYEMLMGLSKNKPRSAVLLEEGFYDSLPDRFKEIINSK